MSNKEFTAKPIINNGEVEVEVYFRSRETWNYPVEEIVEFMESRDDRKYTSENITEGDVRDFIQDRFNTPSPLAEIDRQLIFLTVKID